jgi:hypothetical protein
MAACTLVPSRSPRFVFFTFIIAWLTVTSTMTPMTAVTEHMHRDEGDADHNPEPVFR